MAFTRKLGHLLRRADMLWHRWGSSCTMHMLVSGLWIACHLDECSSHSPWDTCHSLVKTCLSFMWSLPLPLLRLCWPAISDSNLISLTSVMGYFFHYLRDLIYRVNSITWEMEFFMTVGTSTFWRLRWCWLFILVISVAGSWNFIEW